MAYCAPYKKRKDLLTRKCSELFSEAMNNQEDYEKVAHIVLYNCLVNYGTKGILNAFYNANLYIKRRVLISERLD